jgi:hypothetical protein
LRGVGRSPPLGARRRRREDEGGQREEEGVGSWEEKDKVREEKKRKISKPLTCGIHGIVEVLEIRFW